MLLDEGIRKKEKRGKMISFRLPASTDTYLRRTAKSMGGITQVLVDALRLHESMSEGLGPHTPRLQQFALNEKLNWVADEPSVYVRAIVKALDESEKKR
jgi:hypothetical protein